MKIFFCKNSLYIYNGVNIAQVGEGGGEGNFREKVYISNQKISERVLKRNAETNDMIV